MFTCVLRSTMCRCLCSFALLVSFFYFTHHLINSHKSPSDSHRRAPKCRLSKREDLRQRQGVIFRFKGNSDSNNNNLKERDHSPEDEAINLLASGYVLSVDLVNTSKVNVCLCVQRWGEVLSTKKVIHKQTQKNRDRKSVNSISGGKRTEGMH